MHLAFKVVVLDSVLGSSDDFCSLMFLIVETQNMFCIFEKKNMQVKYLIIMFTFTVQFCILVTGILYSGSFT